MHLAYSILCILYITYQLDNRVNDNEDWASYDYIWNKIFKTNIDKYILFVFWFISFILIFLFDFSNTVLRPKTIFLNCKTKTYVILSCSQFKKVNTLYNAKPYCTAQFCGNTKQSKLCVKKSSAEGSAQNLNLRLRMMIMFWKAQHIFQM